MTPQPLHSQSTTEHAAAEQGTPTFPDARFSLHSNQSSIEKRSGFAITSLASLLAEPQEEHEWCADGLFIAGGTSLIGGKPKAGKTTLTRGLALAVAQGNPFLGRETRQGTVVLLALEEKRSKVAEHFRRMGATDEAIVIHVGPAPKDALAGLETLLNEYQPALVIVDPILKFIRLRDGIDYAEVSAALEPITDLARRSGAHISFIHHLGKGERNGGDAFLGSTALFGAVDTGLLMKRKDQARTLESFQRYGDDLPESVLLLDPETGRVHMGGTAASARLEGVSESVLAAVQSLCELAAQTGAERPTETDIREHIKGDQTVTAKALRRLLESGALTRTGAGKRGDPFRYSEPILDA